MFRLASFCRNSRYSSRITLHRSLATSRQKRAAAARKASENNNARAPALGTAKTGLLSSNQQNEKQEDQAPLIRSDLALYQAECHKPIEEVEKVTKPGDIQIDLPSAYTPEFHLPDKPNFDLKKEEYELATPLSSELIAWIGARRYPISVADFMRHALTHPDHGYYTTKMSKDWNGANNNSGETSRSTVQDQFDDDDWDKTGDELTSTTESTGSTLSENVSLSSSAIIGGTGDFITAPEISQLFGECLWIWFVIQWQDLGKPSNFHIVEVGPGKGTLMRDMLNFCKTSFPSNIFDAIRKITFVETSPNMQQVQKQTITEWAKQKKVDIEVDGHEEYTRIIKEANNSSIPESAADLNIAWKDSFASVMPTLLKDKMPVFIICQEFLDALPVHVFEKTIKGWRERLVDVAIQEDPNDKERTKYVNAETQEALDKLKGKQKKPRLRFVLPEDPTPACRTLLHPDSDKIGKTGDIVEVCPEALMFAQDVAVVLGECSGASLIVDYGNEGMGDTLRGFSRHEQVHVLTRPGQVDVTADVDFSALKNAVNSIEENSNNANNIHAFGPISQGKFLTSMGIEERYMQLAQNATEEEEQQLLDAAERLLDPEQMGTRYKVMAVAKKKDGLFAPPAFD